MRPSWGDLDGKTSGVGGHVVRQRAIRGMSAAVEGGRVRWHVDLARPADVTVSVTVKRGGCCGPTRVVRGADGGEALPALPPSGARIAVGVTAQDRENPFLQQTVTRVLRVPRALTAPYAPARRSRAWSSLTSGHGEVPRSSRSSARRSS